MYPVSTSIGRVSVSQTDMIWIQLPYRSSLLHIGLTFGIIYANSRPLGVDPHPQGLYDEVFCFADAYLCPVYVYHYKFVMGHVENRLQVQLWSNVLCACK